MQINQILPNAISNTPPGTTTAGANPANDLISQAGRSFGEVLQSLTESQAQSDQGLNQVSMGEDVDLHSVMIAAEENEVNLRIAMAIRNKLVDAYREVSRMSL